LIRLTQLTTPVWQAPIAGVFDSTTGRLNDRLVDPGGAGHLAVAVEQVPARGAAESL
jgi:hypothetical protein